MTDEALGLIVSTAFATGRGRMHDMRLCREQRPCWSRKTVCLVDSGYQGLEKVHANTLGPYTEVDLVLELPGRHGRWIVEIKRSLAVTLSRGFHSAAVSSACR